jgi:hypothetical protein
VIGFDRLFAYSLIKWESTFGDQTLDWEDVIFGIRSFPDAVYVRCNQHG